jgi:DNA-binding transcriptional MerR regulator
VCELLGIRPHVLRYWEQELELLSPRKDETGKRVYSRSELNLLYRIRHLLYVKKYTLAGVRERLWNELNGEEENAAARIRHIRGELLFIEGRVREWGRMLEKHSGNGQSPQVREHSGDPPGKREGT